MNELENEEFCRQCNLIGTYLYMSVVKIRTEKGNKDFMYKAAVYCMLDIIELSEKEDIAKHIRQWMDYYDLFKEDELYGGSQMKDTIMLSEYIEILAKSFWKGNMSGDRLYNCIIDTYSRLGLDEKHPAWDELKECIQKMETKRDSALKERGNEN